MKESDIQNTICDYLELKGYMFWRQNTIPPTFQKNGQMMFRRMPKHSRNGIPDIIMIVQGRFVGLEVKMPKGKQSASQVEFENDCKAAGGYYYVVRSLEDVINIKL